MACLFKKNTNSKQSGPKYEGDIIIGTTSKSTGNKRICGFSCFDRFDFSRREVKQILITVVGWIIFANPKLKKRDMRIRWLSDDLPIIGGYLLCVNTF